MACTTPGFVASSLRKREDQARSGTVSESARNETRGRAKERFKVNPLLAIASLRIIGYVLKCTFS